MKPILLSSRRIVDSAYIDRVKLLCLHRFIISWLPVEYLILFIRKPKCLHLITVEKLRPYLYPRPLNPDSGYL
jgi:hypothetical protein